MELSKPIPSTLNPGIDQYSTTWHALTAQIEKEIESCRDKLELDKSHDQTTALRARIKALRWVLEAPARDTGP